MSPTFSFGCTRFARQLRCQIALCSLGFGGIFVGSVPVALAQPAPTAQTSPDLRDLEAMRAQMRKIQDGDPQGALALVEKYLEEHPDASVAARNGALKDKAGLLFGKLKDTKGALEATDLMIENASANLKAGGSELDLVQTQITKGHMLILSHQPAPVEALLDTPESWERLVRLFNTKDRYQLSVAAAAVNIYFTALVDQEKYELLSRKCTEIIEAAPWTLIGVNQSLSQNVPARLATSLTKAGQWQQGLAWSKHVYQQASFDKKALADATQYLTSAWASGGDVPAILAFAKAQQSPTAAIAKEGETAALPAPLEATNPLSQVALPDLVVQKSSLLRALATGNAKSSLNAHDQISLDIAQGDWTGAMQKAKRIWQGAPLAPAGALEVCRVFKAADLSTVRANAFLAYLQGQGAGGDPFETFFKEHQADAIQK